MDFLPSITSLALPTTALLLLTLFVVRLRSRRVDRRSAARDALDTVNAWPPEASRVLTVHEAQAYDVLRKAMPGFLILAQVPLSRFLRVPSRHSYADWLQRVGSLSADLLLCDAGSQVLAVIDIRARQESERGRRRHERMAKVLRTAGIQVHVWREGELPAVAEVRHLLAPLAGKAAEGSKSRHSGSTPLIPVAEMSEILAEGDRAALEGSFDTGMEPVPSGFYDEMEAATARR
jgi:hypothetical protein